MRKSISVNQKKRGRPATGRDPVVAVRLPSDVISRLDDWAAQNDASSRSEAIRRLVEHALPGIQAPKQRNPKARSKAHELASAQLDKLINPSAPHEEQQQKKRRLLKGPKEFREMRDKARSKSS